MTFLKQARRRSPAMFLFFVLFIGGTFLSHIFRISSTPFFIYGMYAAPVPVTDEFSFLAVVEDGKKVYNKPEIWNHHRRIAVYYSSRTRDQLLHDPNFDAKNHGITQIYPSKEALQKEYSKWLHRYIEEQEGRKIGEVSLYKFRGKYDPKGNFKLTKVEKVFTEAQR